MAIKTYFKRFESIGATLTAARGAKGPFHEQATSVHNIKDSESKGWAGGYLTMEACDHVEKGTCITPGVLDNAHKLMDKIDTSFRDRESMQWTPSVAGAYPVVPDYLMGQPENMRLRSSVEDDRAPLRIYVEISYSSGVSADAIAQRGTALAALAMRLAEERAVDFCAYGAWRPNTGDGSNVVWLVPVATAPMGLVEVLNVIASTSFARPINFNVTSAVFKEVTGRGLGETAHESYPFTMQDCNEKERGEKLRKYFGMTEKDIIIPRGYLPDERLMRDDPVEWVHKQLEHQRHN